MEQVANLLRQGIQVWGSRSTYIYAPAFEVGGYNEGMNSTRVGKFTIWFGNRREFRGLVREIFKEHNYIDLLRNKYFDRKSIFLVANHLTSLELTTATTATGFVVFQPGVVRR